MEDPTIKSVCIDYPGWSHHVRSLLLVFAYFLRLRGDIFHTRNYSTITFLFSLISQISACILDFKWNAIHDGDMT